MIAGGLLLAGLALWLGVREAASSARQTAGNSGNDRKASAHFPGENNGSPARKTKASDRSQEVRKATHAPERLREFLLAPMEIRGLTLQAALAKLVEAYEDACLISGENPLRLRFTLPPGFDARVNANLGGSLDNSIRLLGGLAGLIVRRDGAEYIFEIPEALADGQPRQMQVPPDFGSQLQRLAGIIGADPSEAPRSTLQETLASLGILNDPGAVRLSGFITLTTPNTKDYAILKALLNSVSADSPLQYLIQPKIVSIPAGTDIDIPAEALDTAGIQSFMRELAKQRGVELMTMPNTTARSGQVANIDIVRELVVPADASGQSFETHDTGVKLGITSTGIGFGQQLDMNLSIVTGDIDPATGRAKINVDASIEESAAWSPDTGARSFVQTHPDGSRTVVLVTTTRVDATGRPMKEPD